MPEPVVLPGAEPFSAPGGPHGVLVLHGFTGNPQSMRALAEALAGAGFTVELPRLPGHGTTVEDMMTTSWTDWSEAAEAAYDELAGRCRAVVVVGLSMGGTLTVWLASRRPEVVGIVVINGWIEPPAPALLDILDQMVAQGIVEIPAIGSDIADPEATELVYERVPISCTTSLMQASDDLQDQLSNIKCPVLVFTSPRDHLVPPVSSDTLAAKVSGPVERVTLERSYHVATLDYDKGLIRDRTISFARRLTGQEPASG